MVMAEKNNRELLWTEKRIAITIRGQKKESGIVMYSRC